MHPTSASESDDIAALRDPGPSRPRRSAARLFSGLLLLAVLGVLKLKGFAILAFEKVRLLFVNPFEGFGALQYAIAGGSMVVTIVAYARKHPLALVLGFVIITLVHEIGHGLVIRAKGLRAGYLVFIPFVGGAFISKDIARSVYDDALIALAGPVAGTIASLVPLQLFKWTGDDMYLSVANIGFFLNLINLLPLGVLDGGRISAAISKWMWVIGGAGLVYHVIQRPNPLWIAILILALFQVYGAILREQDDKTFYEITGAQRAAIAFAYFALVIFLGFQWRMATVRLDQIRAAAGL
jgi:Zn-dependent protease